MKQWLGLLARLVVGGVWLWAGWIKLFEPQESVAAVRAYQLLPGGIADDVGYVLPALEVVLGVALVLGVMTRGAGLISAVLLAAFVVGIASVWARGIEIDCGCFGNGGAKEGASSSYPWEIARDVALFAASIWLVWLRSTRLSLDSLLFRSTAPADPADPDLSDPSDRPEVTTR